MKDERVPKYKPFRQNSSFIKANKQGQIPKDCVHFNFYGKHCWILEDGSYENAACDCVVLKGEFCEKFLKGINL